MPATRGIQALLRPPEENRISKLLEPVEMARNADQSMYRSDGSVKSTRGFLGPMKNRVTGGTMTEFSTDLGDESGTEIPTMVPGQTEEALEYMRKMREGVGFDLKNPIEAEIVRVAREHARKRIANGMSPFYQDEEG